MPCPAPPQVPLSRFLGAMVGSALGDAIGERFGHHSAFPPSQRPAVPWEGGTLRYTDDTVMAIGLAEALVIRRDIDERTLGDLFAQAFFKEPWRGYAGGPPAIFAQAWRTQRHDYYRISQEVGETLYPGGSWGNGAAMRVAPLVYFHDSADLYSKAEAQARITHTHPIAVDAAAVLARAVARAAQSDPTGPFDPQRFCGDLRAFSRNDVVRERIAAVGACLAEDIEPGRAAGILGRGIGAHESVPFALYSFLKSPSSFSGCLCCAAGNGGDVDTMAAMACAVSGAYLGVEAIPRDWKERLENGAWIEQLAAWLYETREGRTPDVSSLLPRVHAAAETDLEMLPGAEE